jgi:hypothetical protein
MMTTVFASVQFSIKILTVSASMTIMPALSSMQQLHVSIGDSLYLTIVKIMSAFLA